jgi:hypothetical protein
LDPDLVGTFASKKPKHRSALLSHPKGTIEKQLNASLGAMTAKVNNGARPGACLGRVLFLLPRPEVCPKAPSHVFERLIANVEAGISRARPRGTWMKRCLECRAP